MNHAADAGRWWRRKAPIGLIAVLGGFLSACGSGASGPVASGPGTAPPPSGPSSSPFPSHADFLHVLRGDSVETYHIDLDTGRLQLAVTQDVGPAHALSGEPGGRFVYAAYGPTGKEFPYHGPDPSVVAYMADEQSGKLQTVSEATNLPITNTGSWLGGWVWLSASSDRVYALWLTTSGGGYHRNMYDYVTHAVTSHGQLGPAYIRDLPEYDPGDVTVDVNSNRFFKTTPDSGKGGFTAHVVEEDGQLTQSGWSNLCGPETLGDSARTPLVALRGFMLASGSTEGASRGSAPGRDPGSRPGGAST